MNSFEFSVIIQYKAENHDQMISIAEALASAGCDDATIGGHRDGTEAAFDREAESLSAAMMSAVADIERAGYVVLRVELPRDCLAA